MATSRRSSVMETCLFIVAFFAIWSVRATALYSIDLSISSDTLRTVYSSLVKLMFWGVPAFVFAGWRRHSPPFQYLGLSVVPSMRRWIGYLVVIGLFLGGVVGFELLPGGRILSLGNISFSITLSGVLSSLVSPLLEEILFRGLLLKEISAFLPGWGANLVTSLLFVGIHLPFWLSQGGLTWMVIANCAGVFIFSLVAGWLYLKSSSIWPSFLAHVANNFIAGLLIAVQG